MQLSLPAVLKDRNFRIYSLGNLISYLGTWAQRIAVGWLSWELSHQAFWVGMIAFAQILPLMALGPLFGTLLDRHDHRHFAMVVNGGSAVLAVLLYVLTAANVMNIGLLFALALALGIANSGYQAVRLAMINEVVAPPLLAGAIAANSVLFNLTRAVGPAIAGVVIARFGLAAAFAVNAISFVAILSALAAVKLRPREVRRTSHGFWEESRQGWRYVVDHPAIRQMMLLSGITSILARGMIELLPVFADSVFHRGSLGLANLTTAAGIGAIIGALVLSQVGASRLLPPITRVSALALGGIVIGFAVCRDFATGMLISGLLGAAIVLCSVGLQVILQSSIRDQFRGRVLGLWTAVNIAGPGIGGAVLGAGANWAGLRVIGVGAGVMCLLLVAAVVFRTDGSAAHPD
jgi:MFS family permease